MASEEKAVLMLEDGFVLVGRPAGKIGEASGEVVFNTSMTGYQEIITDPSYHGQLMTFTYPHIGNYGTNPEDPESLKAHVPGIIVREAVSMPSNWRSTRNFTDYLDAHGIVGIQGIDTRALVLHIREKGAMRGIISSADPDTGELLEKAQNIPSMLGRELVSEVTTKEHYVFQGSGVRGQGSVSPQSASRIPKFKVVAYDFGIKLNILRNLYDLGCGVTIVPADTSASDVLDMKPDGVFLSNGPGDPAAVEYAIENVRQLLGRVPIFGICLGHQLLALAMGYSTFKLKFGHRGANHPVKNLQSGRVEITSQNHGFAVDIERQSGRAAERQFEVDVTHINLNDRTIEGISVPEAKAFSVQYHPEACPGPHDSAYLFQEFIDLMETR